MKLLSIISPIYNCESTIYRMLDSIAKQNIDKNFIEVILCDDNSSDNWREIANSFTSLLPIKFCKVSDHKIHCPGNTRMDGVKYATGQWITFIDDDDQLESSCLSFVLDAISDHSFDYVSTEIDQFSSDMKKHAIIDAENRYLIHGKFYRRSFLEKNNITFKENLYTMEDVYFNSCVFSYLFLIDDFKSHIKFIDKVGYNWIINPNSLSHSYEKNHKDWFIDAHLSEYIYANTAPFLEMLEKYSMLKIPNLSEYTTPLFITAMDVYFRYQSAIYQIGHDIPDKNLDVIHKYYRSISDMFNLDHKGIIETCLRFPDNYFNAFRGCILSSGYFIPEDSFEEFVRKVL